MLGITFMMNTTLKLTAGIRICNNWYPLPNGIIDMVIKKTVAKINNGKNFFSIFLMFKIPNDKSGMIIMAKKCMLNSPTKNTKNAVAVNVTSNISKLILFKFIFKE